MNEKEIAVPNLLEESGVEKMILVIRGKQVLLDRDLAALYGVETRAINQAVKRNMERFPERNCFQLTELEFSNWKSQIVMSNSEKMGLRKMPFAFTEQGVAMLSAVLRTKTAIKVSLAIMDAFVQLRHLMMGNGGLINRLSNVEAKDLEQDSRLTVMTNICLIMTENLTNFSRRWTVASSKPRAYFTTTRSSMPMYLSAT